MNLILTMAGKYSRFTNEGYKIPKYLLPWGNRSILSEILNELYGCFDNIFLIANKSDHDFFGHVQKIMSHYGLMNQNLIAISDTTGQAETAYLGILEADKIKSLTGSIFFHNIDTILYNRKFDFLKDIFANDAGGYVDIFKSNNHEYSYILTKDNLVNVISEKILISDMATSGLYGFASKELFLNNFEDELYISEVIQKLISKNVKINVGKMYSEKETVVLGTPVDYLNLSRMI